MKAASVIFIESIQRRDGKMTKKDYEAIAKELNHFRVDSEIELDEGDMSTEYRNGFHNSLYIIVNRLCDVFEADNDRFDRERFRKAVYDEET